MKTTLSQIMIPLDHYPMVSEEESLENTLNILTEEFKTRDHRWHNYEAVLTTNSKGEVTGMLTLRSALRVTRKIIFPSLFHRLMVLSKHEPTNWSTPKVKQFSNPLKSRLIDISVEVDDAISYVLKHNLNSLLVSNNQKIVGVIRTIDLFWYIEDVL
ncbi:CBS domain-containing protein [Desulfosporosinus hippei]|uniref:CBS domain-containing protein n=1 Tax=Desulfosporosinus hippei DSM 8344 TaxID=1121419 RepID=A0A1G7RLS0_9FIRM|nr:CBS domain-containing protein [Desulfosporosinus hippei]SDG11721.1 CBS domain-containing protein [Desulfosporosinus hippei DSM 8344]